MSYPAGGVHLDGAARDLATLADGTAHVLASATVSALIGAGYEVAELASEPHLAECQALVGTAATSGFRDAIVAAVPDEVANATPLALLLDELPVAALISGYVSLYGGRLVSSQDAGAVRTDVCSGFRADATMLTTLRERGYVPAPRGPLAPVLDADDPLAWHPLAPLADGSMRRIRMVDVTPGVGDEPHRIYAMFRDSAVIVDGKETVLHEYSLTATVDPHTGVITECDAKPRVLPWVECPVTAASAWRLVGVSLSEVRDLVRRDFRGRTTCTHLNDLMRSLGDVEALVAHAH